MLYVVHSHQYLCKTCFNMIHWGMQFAQRNICQIRQKQDALDVLLEIRANTKAY